MNSIDFSFQPPLLKIAMPKSTHTDVAPKNDFHALSRLLDDEGLAASSAPSTTGASPDVENSVDMTAPMGALDLWQSSVTSMPPDVSVPMMDGVDFSTSPDEPMDLLASYDADGRVYQGLGYMLNGAGRHFARQDLGVEPEPSQGYPRAELFEGAALGPMIADDQGDDIDPDWVIFPGPADEGDAGEYPPADAPGHSIASFVLGAVFIVGASFGWGSEVVQ